VQQADDAAGGSTREFNREIDLLARLKSPYIVRLHEGNFAVYFPF
jgi:hypothetical protein